MNDAQLRYQLWQRFNYMSSVYADYVKEHAEILDIAATAKTMSGHMWKNVICLSSAYFGQVQEIINMFEYIAFPKLINRNSMDLNPQSHIEMLVLCVKIQEILSKEMEKDLSNPVVTYSNIDKGDIEIIYGDGKENFRDESDFNYEAEL